MAVGAVAQLQLLLYMYMRVCQHFLRSEGSERGVVVVVVVVVFYIVLFISEIGLSFYFDSYFLVL